MSRPGQDDGAIGGVVRERQHWPKFAASARFLLILANAVFHFFIPCNFVWKWVENTILDRIGNAGALRNEIFLAFICFLICTACHALGHTIAHLPVLHAAGLLPEPLQRTPPCNGTVNATDHAPWNSTITRTELLADFAHLMLGWLTPRRIDIVQRLTFSLFFLANCTALWLFMCVSCGIRHHAQTRASALTVDLLRDDECKWWVACHQTGLHILMATALSVVVHVMRLPFVSAWQGFDAFLYGVQAWHTLLLMVFQWCALGGNKWGTPFYRRLNTHVGSFFQEEILSSLSLFLVTLLMALWLYAPFVAPMVFPSMEGMRPRVMLPTGCRLSGQLPGDSWYSCTSLANHTTHMRIVCSLLFMSGSAFISTVAACFCFYTATAGQPRMRSHLRVLHAMLRLFAFLGSLFCHINLNLSAWCPFLRRRDQQQQQQQQPQQQQQVQQPQQSQTSNETFALCWWAHTLVGYINMLMHGGWCMTIFWLQGSLQIDPFTRYEERFFFLIAGFILFARSATCFCAWRMVTQVPHDHTA